MQQIWMMDSQGVIYKERGDKLPHHKLIVARDDIDEAPPSKDLATVVGHIKPHALIGLTGRGPAFTEVSPHPKAAMGPQSEGITNNPLDMQVPLNIVLVKCSGGGPFLGGTPFDTSA
jgi:malate dehydrogenase (oxaloacetate-decarboxylating)(NADP+)